jgi:hypothetical protein
LAHAIIEAQQSEADDRGTRNEHGNEVRVTVGSFGLRQFLERHRSM